MAMSREEGHESHRKVKGTIYGKQFGEFPKNFKIPISA